MTYALCRKFAKSSFLKLPSACRLMLNTTLVPFVWEGSGALTCQRSIGNSRVVPLLLETLPLWNPHLSIGRRAYLRRGSQRLFRSTARPLDWSWNAIGKDNWTKQLLIHVINFQNYKYLNTARISFSPLEKRMIILTHFLERGHVGPDHWLKIALTSKGVKLQLLPSLTNPKIEEK